MVVEISRAWYHKHIMTKCKRDSLNAVLFLHLKRCIRLTDVTIRLLCSSIRKAPTISDRCFQNFAVGFKVNSERAVQFRKWVNQIAKDYTIKGWVMDDERLKRGTYLTEKYFDEQLERIREIRASERKFDQKITDLYASAMDCGKLLL